MNDSDIVKMYFERNGDAIEATSKKYGGYFRTVAQNVLGMAEDAEECVSDTYLKLWNSIPPNRPDSLKSYGGKIARHLAFDRYQKDRAKKRGAGETEFVLYELEGILTESNTVEQEIDRKELAKAIDDFVRKLPIRDKDMFLCRYWYAYAVGDIAVRHGKSSNYVSVKLSRIRVKLKHYLTERGFKV